MWHCLLIFHEDFDCSFFSSLSFPVHIFHFLDWKKLFYSLFFGLSRQIRALFLTSPSCHFDFIMVDLCWVHSSLKWVKRPISLLSLEESAAFAWVWMLWIKPVTKRSLTWESAHCIALVSHCYIVGTVEKSPVIFVSIVVNTDMSFVEWSMFVLSS